MMIQVSIHSLASWMLLSAAFLLSHNAAAFVPTTTMPSSTSSSSRQHKIRTFASSLDDELDNLEKARANFEFLMQTEGLIKDNLMIPLPHSKDEYTPRPLTESSRTRRELEISLLKSLDDSDEAIEELMALWMVERGQDACHELHRMETVCSPGLVEEESILRNLMDEYGIHWAEPVSRLASLLYFKGQSAESEQWCEIALAVKPWHFEVVHTNVLNALRDQDLAAAVRWQRQALPALNASTKNKRRKAWVARAVEDAQESLKKAERAAQEQTRESLSPFPNEVWQ